MMQGRRVQVYDQKYSKEDGRFHNEEDGYGTFLLWGSDYTEFENGAGNFTIAIIERDDGQVIKREPHLIKFVDPYPVTFGQQ